MILDVLIPVSIVSLALFLLSLWETLEGSHFTALVASVIAFLFLTVSAAGWAHPYVVAEQTDSLGNTGPAQYELREETGMSYLYTGLALLEVIVVMYNGFRTAGDVYRQARGE